MRARAKGGKAPSRSWATRRAAEDPVATAAAWASQKLAARQGQARATPAAQCGALQDSSEARPGRLQDGSLWSGASVASNDGSGTSFGNRSYRCAKLHSSSNIKDLPFANRWISHGFRGWPWANDSSVFAAPCPGATACKWSVASAVGARLRNHDSPPPSGGGESGSWPQETRSTHPRF